MVKITHDSTSDFPYFVPIQPSMYNRQLTCRGRHPELATVGPSSMYTFYRQHFQHANDLMVFRCPEIITGESAESAGGRRQGIQVGCPCCFIITSCPPDLTSSSITVSRLIKKKKKITRHSRFHAPVPFAPRPST